MKIRNGFVSNSSSSSFIIKNIAPRDPRDPRKGYGGTSLSYPLEYPPYSSMTRFLEEYNQNVLISEEEEMASEEFEKRNVLHISAKGGHKYTVEEVATLILRDLKEGTSFKIKTLDHYEDDWEKYLEDYSCIVMDISRVISDETPSLIKKEWGEKWIWNPCKLQDELYNIADPDDGGDLITLLKKTEAYTQNPLFRMFVNSDEVQQVAKSYAEEYKTRKEMLEEYSENMKYYRDGILSQAPTFPDLPCEYLDYTKLICGWCRQHKGNICFNVKEAVDEGNIFIYAKENELALNKIIEIEQTCQCILDAPHMG